MLCYTVLYLKVESVEINIVVDQCKYAWNTQQEMMDRVDQGSHK